MKKCRVLAIMLSFILTFTACAGNMGMMAFADENNGVRPEVELIEDEFVRDDETGHIGIVENDDIEQNEDSDGPSTSVVPRSALPSWYGGFTEIKDKYPCTRNQNPYGTCWAFAATACAEFDMVKNHGMLKDYTDFSELQLAYNTYHTTNDAFGNLDGDENYVPYYASKSFLDVGGNFIFSRNTLAQWKGYTAEGKMPYNWANNTLLYPDSYVNSSLYNEQARLINVRELDIKNDPASVKQAIMDYGAVYISYGHDSWYYSLNGYSLYYCPYNLGVNHDVAIVGWSDDIPASAYSNGPAVPPSNGAWLVRNSWSTNQSVGSEYTYFYLSYEDATLSSTAYALDFTPASTYDNIYQHDGAITHGGFYATKAANIYTVEDTGSASQNLDAVMLSFARDENVNYKIEIYTGLSAKTSAKPTSGYLNSSATTTGWTSERGIYTVPLKKSVSLEPGERYAIVVTILNGDAAFDIEYTTSMTYSDNYGNSQAWFNTVANISPGESFYMYGNTWEDIDEYYGNGGYGNLSIKGLTSNSNKLRTPSIKATNAPSSGKPKITWNKVAGADKYYVYRATSKNGSYAYLDVVYSTSYIDYSAVAEKAYYYRVKAVDSSGNHEKSLRSSYVGRSCDLKKVTGVKLYNVTTSGKPRLTWNKVTGADKYYVYRGTSKNGEYSYIGKTTGTSYTDTSAVAEKAYYYKVRAISSSNSNAHGAKSGYISRVCDLAKVTGIKATNAPSSGKPKITWNKVTGADKYYVYRGTTKNGEYSYIGKTTGTSYTDTSAVAEKAYYYKVRAISASNSNAHGVKSVCINRVCDLARVTGVKITNVASSGKPKLSWSKVSGADKYFVYRTTSKNGEYSYIGKTTGTSYTDISAVAEKTYYYKIKAISTYNSNAHGAKSAYISKMCDLSRPEVSVRRNSSGKPKLSWGKISKADKYFVYRATSKNGEYTYIGKTTNTYYTNTSAKKGKTYYYKVRAISTYNKNAHSAYSVVKSCTAK